MATVYSQDWSAGNSALWTDGFYRRDIDGVDPTYPETWMAEGVIVSGGKVIVNPSYAPDHSTSGIALLDFPTFDGTVGSIEAKYTPNSDALASLSYVPLIIVFGAGGSTDKQIIFEMYEGDGAFTLGPYARNRNTKVMDESGFDLPAPAFTVDQEHTFKVCWKSGTYNGVDINSDGYARFYIDGVLVHAIEDFPVGTVSNLAAASDPNVVTYVGLGTDVLQGGGGLFGSLGDVTFSDSACSTTPTQAVIIGRGAAADDKAKVTSDLTVLLNLDGQGRTVHRPNTLYLAGDLVVTGDVIYTGATSSPTTFYDSLVTTDDGELITDSDGNVVFVEGSDS